MEGSRSLLEEGRAEKLCLPGPRARERAPRRIGTATRWSHRALRGSGTGPPAPGLRDAASVPPHPEAAQGHLPALGSRAHAARGPAPGMGGRQGGRRSHGGSQGPCEGPPFGGGLGALGPAGGLAGVVSGLGPHVPSRAPGAGVAPFLLAHRTPSPQLCWVTLSNRFTSLRFQFFVRFYTRCKIRAMGPPWGFCGDGKGLRVQAPDHPGARPRGCHPASPACAARSARGRGGSLRSGARLPSPGNSANSGAAR